MHVDGLQDAGKIRHIGLSEVSVAEIEQESPAFQADVLRFLQSLPGHVLLDDGRLEFKRKYEIEPAPVENLSWMGIVAY